MPIPDFQSIMLPLLKFVSDGREYALGDTAAALAKQFQLSEDETHELLPTGRQTRFYGRVSWARTYLQKAGLLNSAARGVFCISPRGLDVLRSKPEKINVKFLEQYPEFMEFHTSRHPRGAREKEFIAADAETQTPEEIMGDAYQTWRQSLADEILEKVKACTPAFFERLVVDVLVKMGYGGTYQDAGKAIGKSGDEGIDGIINEDRLGLDVIYIQAKKWESAVGRPEIQKFAGALQGKRAKKGIFITTSDFTKEAQQFASNIENKIILIDGADLAQFMLDYNVGVNLTAAYEIKRIDSDYFED
ncbi:MAG: restriction endonuclease [Anaerolineales bacterium]